MSERGVIVTDPIYDDNLRAAVFRYVSGWPKGAAMVCLSVIGAPGGTYAGEEKEAAEDMASFISGLMSEMSELPDDLEIKVYCIPDSAPTAVYIARGNRYPDPVETHD